MAKIAYILLCHKDPEAVIEQAQRLTAAGDYIVIHFDANASDEVFERIHSALLTNSNVAFAAPRVPCGWGQWSLVEATLRAARIASEAFPRASHFYLLSGDCMPIKSAEYTHQYLDEHEADFIETYDFFESSWIKTGWKEERIIYRHWFNERTQSKRFYAAFEFQKRFGIKRKIPSGLRIMIGSQWWCLRRRTMETLINFIEQRPEIVRFFRTTWIPDEIFFQTLVRHLVPQDQVQCRTPTFLLFSDYGIPVVFYNDHFEILKGQDFLFARKISPQAGELKEKLGRLYSEKGVSFQISNEGPNLFAFLSERGRTGRRFSERFWGTASSIEFERELLIVICKKWHVAKRLIREIREQAQIPALEYIFNEQGTALPDLGGIESSLRKRGRHRRAMIKMLFDHFESERLIICLDPANFDLMQDFYSGGSKVKFLEVDCELSDEYLSGHALRIGLAGECSNADTLSRILPAVRRDINHERDRIRKSKYNHFERISESATLEENSVPLARFLDIEDSLARQIIADGDIFSG